MRDHFSSILIEGVKGVQRCDSSSDSMKEDYLNEQTQGIPSISKKDDMDLITENLSHLGTPLKSEGVPLCIKDFLVSHPVHPAYTPRKKLIELMAVNLPLTEAALALKELWGDRAAS